MKIGNIFKRLFKKKQTQIYSDPVTHRLLVDLDSREEKTGDNISDYTNSRSKLIKGVNKVADIIRPTYGAAGSNVVLEEGLYPYHRVANDGKLISDSIRLFDPIEQMGANLIKEACDKQEKEVGDGRKTTVILTSAILNEGIKIKAQPLEIKRSLDACLPEIIKSIDSQKKEISLDDIHHVATISSEDPEIGKVIGDIYKQIGREGIIEIDSSNLPTTFYETVEGIRLRNAGYFGAYSCTESEKAVYKDPKILISTEKITSVDQLTPICKLLAEAGINELIIYCEDIDMSVASRLAMTHIQGGFKTLIIKSPKLWKDWLYEDFALITGATPVSTKDGKPFKNVTLKDLGTCSKIISTKDETRIIGIKDISAHIAKIEAAAKEDDQLKLRASWLNTKVAILKVGANSETELSYKLKKAKDACHAAYYALKDGVVMGGGYSLVNVLVSIVTNGKTSIGWNIIKKSISEPYIQLCKNEGVNSLEIDESVIDPALVIKSAITNAISIAGTILTSSGAIPYPREKSLGALQVVNTGNQPAIR